VDDVVVGTVVVGVPHGHASGAGLPTATLRHTRASVAVVGSVPFGAQTHAAYGSQVRSPTATPRMARQSVAVGWLPLVSGCAQSPLAARAGNGATTMQIPTSPAQTLTLHASHIPHLSLVELAIVLMTRLPAARHAAAPATRSHRRAFRNARTRLAFRPTLRHSRSQILPMRTSDPIEAADGTRTHGTTHGRLLLVLSPERSGSTLLSAMLGAHSAIVAPPELFLLRYAVDSWQRDKVEAYASFRWLLQRVGEATDDRTVVEQFRGRSTLDLYRWLLCRIGPGHVLVDKTPAYGRDAAVLARAEELSPAYVWLVRHPLGVANSWIERRRARRWRIGGRLGTAAAVRLARARGKLARRVNMFLDQRAVDAALARWCAVHETIASFLEDVPRDRIRRVAYEELVRSPQPTLEALCAWLNVAFEPAMLEPWQHLPDALTWGVGDGLIRSHDSIRASRADTWREHLDERRLDPRTRALMKRLGVADVEGDNRAT